MQFPPKYWKSNVAGWAVDVIPVGELSYSRIRIPLTTFHIPENIPLEYGKYSIFSL